MKLTLKRISAIILSIAMLLAFMPQLGGVSQSFADDGGEVKSVTVDVLAQKDENTLLKAFQSLEVRADMAEQYGYTEPEKVRDPDESAQIPLANEVTTLDVLVKVMSEVYGDSFTRETASDYLTVSNSGTITKIFGGESSILTGFTVNGKNPAYKGESDFGVTGSLIDDSIVNDGDSLRFFRTFDDGMGTGGLFSSMLFFDGVDQKAYSAISGEKIELNVEVGYAFEVMMGSTEGLDQLSPEGAEITLKDQKGNTVNTATADESGKAELTVVEPGEFDLIVSGYEGNEWDEHFVTPYAKVTVSLQDEVEADVDVAVSSFNKSNEFDFIPQTIKVSSHSSEKYGEYRDIIAGNGGEVTFSDVIYAIHEAKYGSSFTKETAGDYIEASDSGYYSKLFEIPTFNISYLINEDLSMTGGAFELKINNGDQVALYKYLDESNYTDLYTHFTKTSATVRKGEEIELQIEGIGWSHPLGPVSKYDGETVAAATYDSSGKLTTIEGVSMEDNGVIKFKFTEEGEYNVTALGKVNGAYTDYSGGEPTLVSDVAVPIVLPHATITVISDEGKAEAEAAQNDADTANDKADTANKAAVDAAKAAENSKKAAEEAAKTPGDAAVKAAEKALEDAKAAAAKADEAKKAADAAVTAAEKAVENAKTTAEKEAAEKALETAKEAAKKADENKKAADKAVDDAKAAVKNAEDAKAKADKDKKDDEADAEAKAKKVKKVTVNVKTVNKKAVDKAVKKAGGSNKYVTTIILGKKVKKVSKNTFKTYKKVKTIEVKTKKLTKKSVKGSLKGSKVKTVKVKVGKKAVNKKYVKKYKKIFTKKNAGKKVNVKI